jgi:hypothetical protein
MKSVTLAVAGLAVGLVGAALYFIVLRRPHLQARVFVQGQIDLLHLPKPCPDGAVWSTNEEKADYSLSMVWRENAWFAVLLRTDHVVWKLDDSQDLSKILRQVCRVVAEDFPALLSTERSRPLSAVTATPSDAVARYELKDYRHGNITGLALVDTELGRIWVMRDLVDAKGKTIRTSFSEMGVDDLWKTNEEIWERIDKARSEDSKRRYFQEWDELRDVKKATRPRAIQDAEKTSPSIR